MDRLEVRQSFSASKIQTTGNDEVDYYQFSSSSSLDLYPVHSMIFRLQFNANQYLDMITSLNDYFDIALNVKMSLRF